MEQDQWEYKIGADPVAIILSALMTGLFGGLAFWLYRSQNGAFLFGGILAAIMLVVLLLVIYRAIFVKTYFGRYGFYHQTKPGNGKYYNYSEIKRAWTTSGKDINGADSYFCYFETAQGQTVRFPYTGADIDSVDFFTERVKETAFAAPEPDDADRIGIIDGKAYGKIAIVIALVLVVMVAAMVLPAIPAGLPLIDIVLSFSLPVVIVFLTLINYFCFKVEIGVDGFFVRTMPFNGRFYAYSEIQSAHDELKVYRHRRVKGGTGNRLYYYFFVFTDKSGKTRKFLFQKDLNEREIELLKARIEAAKNN